jgi:hypothetical protein
LSYELNDLKDESKILNLNRSANKKRNHSEIEEEDNLIPINSESLNKKSKKNQLIGII